MPRILPNSSWRAVSVDSSTSTTRDAFSLVTPLTTHPPYVCSRRNRGMLMKMAAPTRPPLSSSSPRVEALDGRCARASRPRRLVRRQAGVREPLGEGEVGAQHVDDGGQVGVVVGVDRLVDDDRRRVGEHGEVGVAVVDGGRAAASSSTVITSMSTPTAAPIASKRSAAPRSAAPTTARSIRRRRSSRRRGWR